jgi:hypothetical protein
MKFTAKIGLILLGIIGTIFFSCRKFEEYPIEPEIKFDQFVLLLNNQTGKTERGVLSVSYTDGDGDLGLRPRDTFPPFNSGSKYYYNFLITYFEKQNGVFVEVPLLSWNPDEQKYDTITFSSRFPNLTPDHGNKAIKGIIQDTLYVNNPLSDFDTIKFKVSIYDRALHLSNEVETSEIIVVK